MSKKRDRDDYDVGYGKPPKDTRFQKGRSGNPKGRPKGTRNLKTDLTEVLGERITVREGDRARTVSKQRAVVISVVNRTLKGDARAAGLLVSMMFRLLDPDDGADGHEVPLIDDELEILEAFAGRVREAKNDPEDPVDEEAA